MGAAGTPGLACTCQDDSDCTESPYTKCNYPVYAAQFSGKMICQKPCQKDSDCIVTGDYLAYESKATVRGGFAVGCDSTTGKCVECKTSADCLYYGYGTCDTTTGGCIPP
jgi:hypothetical protein